MRNIYGINPTQTAAQRLASNPRLMNRPNVQSIFGTGGQPTPPPSQPGVGAAMVTQPSTVGAPPAHSVVGLNPDTLSQAMFPQFQGQGQQGGGQPPPQPAPPPDRNELEDMPPNSEEKRQQQMKDMYAPGTTPAGQSPFDDPNSTNQYVQEVMGRSRGAKGDGGDFSAAKDKTEETTKEQGYQGTLEGIAADLLAGTDSGYEAKQAQEEAARAYNDQMAGIENLGVDTPWALTAEAQARAMKGGMLAKSAEQQRAARMAELMGASGIEQGLYQTEQTKTPDSTGADNAEVRRLFGENVILTADGEVQDGQGRKIDWDQMNDEQKRWYDDMRSKRGLLADTENNARRRLMIELLTKQGFTPSQAAEFYDGYLA